MLGPTHNSAPQAIELTADSGFRVRLLDVGASITSMVVPGKNGPVDVVLGYNDEARYETDSWFMGSTIGRYANRLAHGRLVLGRNTFQLATDPDSGHCLHGGEDGFHCQRWTVLASTPDSVSFHHVSPHGSAGFPGRLDVRVTYTILEPSALLIDFSATTDRTTVLSMTNHAYFNLHGDGSSIDGHRLRISADRDTPVDEAGIPVGEIVGVDGTRFDFREPRSIGSADRYDTNYAVGDSDDTVQHVATLSSPVSGIRMDVRTSQPGMQFYTGDQLGEPFSPRRGLCLETQGFPDAPNQATFPGTTLTAADTYEQRTIYEFSEDAGE